MKKVLFWLLLLLASGCFIFSVFHYFAYAPVERPTVDITPQPGTRGKFIVALDHDYWPYSWKKQDGTLLGHDIELSILIANRLKKTIEFRPMPWLDAVKAIEAGDVDALLTCECNERLSRQYFATHATVIDEFVVFSKDTFRTFDDLYNVRVGVMRDGNALPLVRAIGINTNLREYETNEAAIEALLRGACECVVMRRMIGRVLAESLGLTKIRENFALGPSNMCIGIAKGKPALLRDVNNVLLEFKRNGTMRRLQRKWLMRYESKHASIYWKNHSSFAIIGVVSFFAIAILLFCHKRKKIIKRAINMETPSFRMLIILTAALFSVWVAINGFHTYIEERNRHILAGQYEVERAAQQLDFSLKRLHTVLNSISELAMDYLNEAERTPREIESWLRAQLLRLIRTVDKSYVNIALAREGEYLAGNNWIPAQGYTPENREFFIRAKANPGVIITLPPHHVPDRDFLEISVSKMLPDKKTVCLIETDLSSFEPIAREVFGADWSYAFFVAPDKSIVARAGSPTHLEIDEKLLTEIFNHSVGKFEYKNGNEKMMVFSSKLESGWRAVVVQEQSTFFNPVRTTLIENMIIAVIMFIVTFIFLHRLFAWISKQQSERLNDIEDKLRLKTLLAEEAVRTEKTKSTFLATMSHEIRTPLNSIVGFAEFLKSPESTDVDRALYVDGILKSSNALLALINNILDLSKLETGNMIVLGGLCSFTHLFDEMHSIFFYLAMKKNVKMTGTLSPNMPSTLSLREERIRQILINLIGNAVKFTAEGTISYEASWQPNEGDEKRGTLTMTVTDTGLGIGPKLAEKLFDPFKQDGGVRGGKVYQSTGLGLPICKRLVEAAGGTLTFTSVVNKGTTFVVTIPNVETVEKHEPKISQSDIRDLIAAKKDRLHIVIVDDVPLNLMIASRQVQLLGVEPDAIESFVNPEEALALLKEPFDGLTLLFTDVWMPNMNGEELARKVRECNTQSYLFIYALTADSDSSTSFDVSVFDSVLLKPITSDALARVMASALSSKGDSECLSN